jgi:hypothetical protein
LKNWLEEEHHISFPEMAVVRLEADSNPVRQKEAVGWEAYYAYHSLELYLH